MTGVRVPEAVAAMPPGRELAAALADLDSAAVANADTVVLLQAWARQLAHVQARFVDAVVQVGRATPFSGSDGERPSVAESAWRQLAVGEWAAGELAAALRWTHRHAERELGFAVEMIGLPVVFEALDAGVLDRGRAWTFADVLGAADLTAEQIGRICEVLVPRAPRWTTGQLRARLLRMIIEIDPGYAERRYRAAVRDRGVVGYLSPDGTGTVSGHGLAAEEAVAACERLDSLADEVRRAGHRGTVHQIRADLFTRLLDGRFHGLTREAMIAALLAEGVARVDAPEEGVSPPASAGAAADDGDATDAGDDDAAVADDVIATGDDDAAVADDVIATGDDAGSLVTGRVAARHGAPGTADTDTDTDTDTAADDDTAAAGTDAADEVAGRVEGVDAAGDAVVAIGDGLAGVRRRSSGGEIRVGLSTLLHRDERTGEVPGWGPVLAEVARVMVAGRRGAQWRFAVTDADGYLIFAGVTRRRPGVVRQMRGGIVEIHVSACLLAELAAAAEVCGEWAGVVADIAGQYAARDQHQQLLNRHPGDRFARAALRRHVQVRDRRCVAPGCRRPARRCQLDHTIDHVLGGETVPENSGPLCRRHHMMKHEAGWRLEQTEPGIFRWTSPLGQVYWSRGEPVCPPAGPVHPRPDEPDSWWEPPRRVDGPILRRPPPSDSAPPRRPAPPSDDTPPPF